MLNIKQKKNLHTNKIFFHKCVGSLSIYTDIESLCGEDNDFEDILAYCHQYVMLQLYRNVNTHGLLTTAAVVRTHAVVYARVTAGICMYS